MRMSSARVDARESVSLSQVAAVRSNIAGDVGGGRFRVVGSWATVAAVRSTLRQRVTLPWTQYGEDDAIV